MKNLVSENLNTFVRGQDSKKALDIGYVRNMPENASELSYYLNLGSEIQYEVELSNHPTTKNTLIGKDNKNPSYVVTGGMEGGFGLPTEDNRVVYFNVYIDPLELTIFGELSLTHFTKDYEKSGDEDYKVKKRSIPNDEITIMSQEARKVTYDLLQQANIETL